MGKLFLRFCRWKLQGNDDLVGWATLGWLQTDRAGEWRSQWAAYVEKLAELANGPREKKTKEGAGWANFEGEAGFHPMASW
jgi:hypothetical protein